MRVMGDTVMMGDTSLLLSPYHTFTEATLVAFQLGVVGNDSRSELSVYLMRQDGAIGPRMLHFMDQFSRRTYTVCVPDGKHALGFQAVAGFSQNIDMTLDNVVFIGNCSSIYTIGRYLPDRYHTLTLLVSCTTLRHGYTCITLGTPIIAHLLACVTVIVTLH